MSGLTIPYGPGVTCHLPGTGQIVISLSESVKRKAIGIVDREISAYVARAILADVQSTANRASFLSKPVVIFLAAAIPLVVGGAVFAAGVATCSLIGALFLKFIGGLILGLGVGIITFAMRVGLGELTTISKAMEEKAHLAGKTLRRLQNVDGETMIHLETKEESRAGSRALDFPKNRGFSQLA